MSLVGTQARKYVDAVCVAGRVGLDGQCKLKQSLCNTTDLQNLQKHEHDCAVLCMLRDYTGHIQGEGYSGAGIRERCCLKLIHLVPAHTSDGEIANVLPDIKSRDLSDVYGISKNCLD